MSKVQLQYGVIAPLAKQHFAPTATDVQFPSKITQLMSDNMSFPNYASPCESYHTFLDGAASLLKSSGDNNVAFWSKSVSSGNGTFTSPIQITFQAEYKYTSKGLTLTFDTDNDIFPTSLLIEWYRDTTLLSSGTYAPTSSKIEIIKNVELYNKVVITFYSLNMPYNCLKMRSIEYGIGIVYTSSQIKSASLTQEINAISEEIPISTGSFTLVDVKDVSIDFFQKQQPVGIYFGEDLKAMQYVRTWRQLSPTSFCLETEDTMGLLDNILFDGGIYEKTPCAHVLKDIFDTAHLGFDCGDEFYTIYISGHIPATTCREALKQVMFATQARAVTANLERIKIELPIEDITQHIGANRIMQEYNIELNDRVSGIQVVSHRHALADDCKATTLYDASKNGTGTNIRIEFTSPVQVDSLSIVEGNIVKSNANYAIIDAYEGCLLQGILYEDQQQVNIKINSNAPANEQALIATIDSATLISADNVDNVVEKCYNYYSGRKTAKIKIAEATQINHESTVYGSAVYGSAVYGSAVSKVKDTPVSVGDIITFENIYDGSTFKGIVEKQTFNMNGNILIKDCEVKEIS